MDPHLLSSITQLSNTELLARVKRLAARERHATAVLIAHLAELDERRLYLTEGYSSLFVYCTQMLHLSEHAAYNRIEAARAARKFPIILERLADGSVTLTAIRLLAPHLTLENHQDLLARTRHQSKRDVEELISQLHPQPPVPARIRRLPPPRHRPTACAAIEASQPGPTHCTESSKGTASEDVPRSELQLVPAGARGRTPATIAPLGVQRYRIQFTASAETQEKLRRAQALLRHQVPDGDVATIIDQALGALLAQVAKQKVAATDRPRRKRKDSDGRCSRHIPSAVKREVWIRDGGRCAFVSNTGRRCSEEGFLEFHHVRPYAAGGAATAENIQLRCRAHNGFRPSSTSGPSASPTLKKTNAAYSVCATSSQASEGHAGYSVPSGSSQIGEARETACPGTSTSEFARQDALRCPGGERSRVLESPRRSKSRALTRPSGTPTACGG